MFVIAHVSDPHVDGSAERAERVARVTRYLRGLTRPVDVVLLCGDIVDSGRREDYEEVLALFAGTAPVLALPGNHDDPSALSAALGDEAGASSDSPHRCVVLGGVRFVLLDTTVPGEVGGALGAEGLSWLDRTLADPGAGATPTVVATHHPPVPVGHPFVDGVALADSAPFGEVLSRHPAVVAVLVGHAHTAGASTVAGVPVLLGPGVASTLVLPFESRPGDDAVVTSEAPPALALHLLTGRHLTTHFRVLG
ncbi:metallophosphoesterase [Actinoalloteichus sp. AHMU CJ021]|uniref:metallophosphoesterase n=1 Tax=Actinoalloteichus sp. AHMU CJ021 TaxID=2072503 RepID=UPI0026D08280